MKKVAIGGLAVVIILVLVGLNLYLGNRDEGTASNVSESTTELSNQESSAISKSKKTSNSTAESTFESEDSNELIQEEIEAMLKDFGTRWVNYDSIYGRNQSVREYLTEKCITANSIDTNPNVELKTFGEIKQVYRSIEDDSLYVLTGTEERDTNMSTIILEVTVDKEQMKIDRITINYVRQAS